MLGFYYKSLRGGSAGRALAPLADQVLNIPVFDLESALFLGGCLELILEEREVRSLHI